MIKDDFTKNKVITLVFWVLSQIHNCFSKKGLPNFSLKLAWKFSAFITSKIDKSGWQTWKRAINRTILRKCRDKCQGKIDAKKRELAALIDLKKPMKKNIIYWTEWRDFSHRVSTVVVVVVRTSTKLKWSRWKWAALCSSSVRQQKQTSSSLYVVLWNHRIVWFT